MTKIINGFAQPDVFATDRKSKKEIYIFVEEGIDLFDHEEAIIKTVRELIRTKFSILKEIRIAVI